MGPRGGNIRKKADEYAILRRTVWDRYEADQPPPGNEYLSWVNRTCEELGLTEKQVRKVIAEQTATYMHFLNQDMRTNAQKAAEALGAGLVTAISRLNDCMNATKKRPLTDKDGRMVRNEDNEIEWIEVPDWPVIKGAAVDLVKLHGGFPAEKHEVDHRHQHLHAHLTDAEAISKLGELRKSIDVLSGHLAAGQEATGGGAGAGAAVEGEGSPKGPLFLADPGDKNEG